MSHSEVVWSSCGKFSLLHSSKALPDAQYLAKPYKCLFVLSHNMWHDSLGRKGLISAVVIFEIHPASRNNNRCSSAFYQKSSLIYICQL
jgi:hypothetical protein